MLYYDSSHPPLFPCILFSGSDMFVSFSWCTFSSCESMRESSIHSADDELFWQSPPRIRVNAQTPRCHFKMLFNSIKRAASASWSGLIWQQGISLDCHCALSMCLCLSAVLFCKWFVSRFVTDTFKIHFTMGLFLNHLNIYDLSFLVIVEHKRSGIKSLFSDNWVTL